MFENKSTYKTVTTQYFKTHFASILRDMEGWHGGDVTRAQGGSVFPATKVCTLGSGFK